MGEDEVGVPIPLVALVALLFLAGAAASALNLWCCWLEQRPWEAWAISLAGVVLFLVAAVLPIRVVIRAVRDRGAE